MSQNSSPVANFSITQNIPVADHVYKYLVKICGTDHIQATRTTFIGSLVLSLQGRNYDVKPSKKKFRKVFKADVSEIYYEKTGLYITPTNAQLFNDQIDKKFRDELYRAMLMSRHRGEKLYLETMRQFLDFYDITEEDLKSETLYRDFKRKKDEMSVNLPPVLPKGTKFETSNFVPQ